MCNNNNGCFGGCGDSFIWIIILFFIICCCGGNGNNNGCGCN